MNNRLLRITLLLTGLVVVALFFVAIDPRNGRAENALELLPAPPADSLDRMAQPAEKVFKNIQIFKGATAGEVMGTMEYMESALGVGCNYCHVQGDFSSDDRPTKNTARAMMRMVDDINTRHFSAATVTCNTCHHGSPVPAAVPSLQQSAWTNVDTWVAEAFAPDTSATLDNVLDKYIQALGGRTAIGKVTSRVATLDEVSDDGHHTPVELYQRAPQMLRAVTKSDDPRRGEMIAAYTGTVAWGKFGNRDASRLINDRLAQSVRMAELFPATRLKERYTNVRLVGRYTIDGHDYHIVDATGPDGAHDRLYFDAASGLLTRRYVEVPTLLGQIPFSIKYEDYRSIDGVTVPYRQVWTSAHENSTDVVTNLRHNVSVADSLFTMPKGK